MYAVLYDGGAFLGDEQIRILRRNLLAMGAGVQNLRILVEADGFWGWAVSPKMHIAQHLDMQAQLSVNPRCAQNYAEESAIGTVARVWKRSATGKYRNAIQRYVLRKRVVALAVLYEGVLEPPADRRRRGRARAA